MNNFIHMKIKIIESIWYNKDGAPNKAHYMVKYKRYLKWKWIKHREGHCSSAHNTRIYFSSIDSAMEYINKRFVRKIHMAKTVCKRVKEYKL